MRRSKENLEDKLTGSLSGKILNSSNTCHGQRFQFFLINKAVHFSEQ